MNYTETAKEMKKTYKKSDKKEKKENMFKK